MTSNLHAIDRILRVLVAAIIAGLYFSGSLSGAPLIALAVLAVIFVLTSAIGFCPLYKLIGISTKK